MRFIHKGTLTVKNLLSPKKLLAVAAALVFSGAAHASLTTSYVFNGKGNWSLDGCGSNNSSPVCTIDAAVPTGSTIVAAYLYSSMNTRSTIPSVTFEGQVYSGASWTSLGNVNYLQAYRADVTSQVSSLIGGGSASPFSFKVNSESNNSSTDGEVLAIIYSNPTEQVRTIAFLDGYSNQSGDSTAINLAAPLTSAQLSAASFEATLSLGIGYSYQASSLTQHSNVDVNGSALTRCAGGEDDGGSYNGGLITVGGLGDNPSNNHNCSASNPRADDELYSLKPFLAAGDSQISIKTSNPSFDDNIFFAGLNLTAVAGVNTPPPPVTSVPESNSLVMFCLGLLGLVACRRKKIV